jgi:DMSO reductase anchor subunit
MQQERFPLPCRQPERLPARLTWGTLMVKNSWLSREVITLSLSVGCALLYLLAFHFRLPGNIRLLIGAAGILSSIGFYISSSMVYASVTFIREWANAYTPLSFLVFGIASGAGATLPLLYYSNSFVSIIRIMDCPCCSVTDNKNSCLQV